MLMDWVKWPSKRVNSNSIFSEKRRLGDLEKKAAMLGEVRPLTPQQAHAEMTAGTDSLSEK